MTAAPKLERCPMPGCGGECEVAHGIMAAGNVFCLQCSYRAPTLAAHNQVALAVRLFPAATDLARGLEWAGSCDLEDGGVAEACPVCGVEAVEQHLAGCQLHALLTEAQGVARE